MRRWHAAAAAPGARSCAGQGPHPGNRGLVGALLPGLLRGRRLRPRSCLLAEVGIAARGVACVSWSGGGALPRGKPSAGAGAPHLEQRLAGAGGATAAAGAPIAASGRSLKEASLCMLANGSLSRLDPATGWDARCSCNDRWTGLQPCRYGAVRPTAEFEAQGRRGEPSAREDSSRSHACMTRTQRVLPAPRARRRAPRSPRSLARTLARTAPLRSRP